MQWVRRSLVTGFVVSMRTELAASYSNEHIQRTKMVAQGAVSHAIDILRTNIPDPARLGAVPSRVDVETEPMGAGSTTLPKKDFRVRLRGDSNVPAEPVNWVINPGRLTIVDRGGESQAIHVPLHTGAFTGDPSDPVYNADSFDLNEPLPGSLVPPIVFPMDDKGVPLDFDDVTESNRRQSLCRR